MTVATREIGLFRFFKEITMGKGDGSKKMRQRQQQNRKKTRVKRKIQKGKSS